MSSQSFILFKNLLHNVTANCDLVNIIFFYSVTLTPSGLLYTIDLLRTAKLKQMIRIAGV